MRVAAAWRQSGFPSPETIGRRPFDELPGAPPAGPAIDGAEQRRLYQVLNRWRELLNEFARLGLVAERLSLQAAVARLEAMALETIYQPEDPTAGIHLLGPLEASGLEFDALWIVGLTAAEWPGRGRYSPLIPRQLQVERGMPDATPEDTLEFSATVLNRLLASATDVECSFARTVDGAEQSPTAMLVSPRTEVRPLPAAPGWHACQLRGRNQAVVTNDDPVPVLCDEKVYGGAAIIDWQLNEPFVAFARGRLGCRELYRQVVGINPPIRGKLLHDALYRLYNHLPDSAALQAESEHALHTRIEAAVTAAAGRWLRNADATLQQLLRLERERTRQLLFDFCREDALRAPFVVSAVEAELIFRRDALVLPLRADRIDRVGAGRLAILDYKTGAPRTLAVRGADVRDRQLFVYARALGDDVAGVALVTLDARTISVSGAGEMFTGGADWPSLREIVFAEIDQAVAGLLQGDVRLAADRGLRDVGSLSLISRYVERRRES